MSSYKPYPKYKPSSVEWLGDVPVWWGISRIGRLAFTGMGQTILREMLEEEPSADALPVYSASEAEAEFGYFMNPSVRLSNGDLVVGARGSIGLTRRISAPSTCTQTTIWVKPIRSQIESAYLYWCMIGGREQLFPFDKTAIPMLTVEQVQSGGIPLPPLPEQHQIATFLDRECGKLDALQAKQERLIELLKEKRQALISHAVTKGLDPNAKLKPSGVEWLGDVPVHWKLVSFGQCVAITGGQVDPTAEPFLNYVMIAPNHIESKMGNILALETAAEQGAESGKYLCKKGDVIYSKIRPALAKACLCPQDQVLCSADMYPMRGMLGLTNEFLLKVLLSAEFTAFAIMESDRVAMPKLNRETLATTHLPIPPLAEQRAIVAHLDEKCGKIDRLMAKAERAIALLKERRSALISAAVTGKIDVRDVAADCIRQAQPL